MSNLKDDNRGVLRRSRAVADNADFLSLALLSGDRGRIEDAVTDLMAAYDSLPARPRASASSLGLTQWQSRQTRENATRKRPTRWHPRSSTWRSLLYWDLRRKPRVSSKERRLRPSWMVR